MDAPGTVTIRHSRAGSAAGALVLLALAGSLLLHTTRTWSANPMLGNALALGLVLVLGTGGLSLARGALGGRSATLAGDRYEGPQGTILLADVTRIRYNPAQATTWTGDRSDARRLSGQRLHTTLEVSGAGTGLSIGTESAEWGDAVRVIAGWAARRPETVADERTRAFLMAQGPQVGADPPSPRDVDAAPTMSAAARRGWWLAAVAVAAASAGLLLAGWALWVAPLLELRPLTLLQQVGGILVLAAWSSVFLTFAALITWTVGRGVLRIPSARPGWLFQPGSDGRYSWLVGGRASIPKDPSRQEGWSAGVALRWVLALAYLVVVWLVPAGLAALVLVAVLR